MSKTLIASLSLSCLSVLVTAGINVSIARRYIHANTEARLWFFLTESTFFFQYFVVILGIAALILAQLTKSKSKLRLVAIGLSLISIILVFVGIWRLFVLI
jgi:hypothetical protein